MSKKYTLRNGIGVEVSDEVYKILKKSDRRIKYVEKDLKETRYIEIPSRVDSFDRLMEVGKDLADNTSDFQDGTIFKIMLVKRLRS